MARPLFLVFHRIIDSKENDVFNLNLTLNYFQEIIDILKSFNNQVLLPKDQVSLIKSNNNKKIKTISLTFDDGYIDNYTNAYPILLTNRIPAAFYLCNVFKREIPLYWWDLLELVYCNNKNTPTNDCDIKIIHNNNIYTYQFLSENFLDSNWKQKAFIHFCTLCRVVPLKLREEILTQIYDKLVADKNDRNNIYQLMQEKEILDIANSDLFEIGVHTKSHPVLAKLSYEEQYNEIINNKNTIQNLINRPISGMAYPHGSANIDYNEFSKKAATECKLNYACAVINKNWNGGLYEIPRISVCNQNFKFVKQKLLNYLNE